MPCVTLSSKPGPLKSLRRALWAITSNFPEYNLHINRRGARGLNTSFIAFDNEENAYYLSHFKSPAAIDRDAIRFQGLEHLASISHDKPQHCAAVIKPSSTRKHRSHAPT